jgi:hypothetical protein
LGVRWAEFDAGTIGDGTFPAATVNIVDGSTRAALGRLERDTSVPDGTATIRVSGVPGWQGFKLYVSGRFVREPIPLAVGSTDLGISGWVDIAPAPDPAVVGTDGRPVVPVPRWRWAGYQRYTVHRGAATTTTSTSTSTTTTAAPASTTVLGASNPVSGSIGDPNDFYMEYTITGGDFHLKEGTTTSYEGVWDGGPITVSGRMVVVVGEGFVTNVSMRARVSDEEFSWPPEGEDGAVGGETVEQTFQVVYDRPADDTWPWAHGGASVSRCGGICDTLSVDFTVVYPVPG